MSEESEQQTKKENVKAMVDTKEPLEIPQPTDKGQENLVYKKYSTLVLYRLSKRKGLKFKIYKLK